MINKYTKNDITRAVSKVFPDELKDCILDLLNFYGVENYEYEKERVHLAIVKLSKGNADKLLQYIKLAKEDYRDVLSLAEYDKDRKEISNPYQELLKD
jgi:hypothetical protein